MLTVSLFEAKQLRRVYDNKPIFIQKLRVVKTFLYYETHPIPQKAQNASPYVNIQKL